MEDNNNTGAENEASNNSSQQDGSYPSQADLTSRLNNILFDDEPVEQTEEGEADSNQPEDPHSESESEMDTDSVNDGNEVHSESEEEYDNDVSRGVQKRIDKLTAKRKEAEEEIAKLKTEVESLKQSMTTQKPVEQIPDTPHSDLNTIAEIEAEIAQARQVRDWAEANADGFTQTDAEGNETHYDPAQIRQIKINAMKAIETTLPQRYQYIQARDQIETIVAKEYPWWKDKSSKERQIAEQFLNAFPQIKKFPDYKMVIGDYLRGVRLREQRGGQPQVQKAPIQPRSSGVAPSVKKQEVHRQEAYSRFTKSGKVDDLSKLMEDYL